MRRAQGPPVVAVLRHLKVQGLQLLTRLQCGKRILIARPTKKVTSEIRGVISSNLDALTKAVRGLEVEEEEKLAAKPLELIRESIAAYGLDISPVLIHEEGEREAMHEAGKLPLTPDEAKALSLATSDMITCVASAMSRFQGDELLGGICFTLRA